MGKKAATKAPAKDVKDAKVDKKKAAKDSLLDPILIDADQLSFNHDKEIDNMARYLEERIPQSKGLVEVVRNRNMLELQLTKNVSKRDVKQYVTKYLHRAGLRLDYRVLATHEGRKEADFHIYPRRVYEV